MARVDQPTTPIPSVLFVCTANQIRSPIAVAVLRHILQEKDAHWQHWIIESAGTWAEEGRPINPTAVLILQERGLRANNHLSRTVSRSLLSRFKLILTMESGQKEALQVEFSEYADRVKMLSEMAGEVKNVPDPIGRPLDDFLKTADMISAYLEQGLENISRLARK